MGTIITFFVVLGLIWLFCLFMSTFVSPIQRAHDIMDIQNSEYRRETARIWREAEQLLAASANLKKLADEQKAKDDAKRERKIASRPIRKESRQQRRLEAQARAYRKNLHEHTGKG